MVYEKKSKIFICFEILHYSIFLICGNQKIKKFKNSWEFSFQNLGDKNYFFAKISIIYL